MTWFKVDDRLAFHPKVLSAGNEAMGLWVRAGAYCAQMLTNGHVPLSMLAPLGADESVAERLVAAGLWREEIDGYSFHDWHDLQPTRESVEADREAARERMRELRAGRKSHRNSTDVRANIDRSSEEVRNPGPSRTSNEVQAPQSSAKTRGTRLPDSFELDDKLIAYTREKGPAVNLDRELEKFRNFWASASGANAVKRDWRRAWQNWVLSAQERAEANGWKPSAQPVPSKASARDAWLAARGVTREEYDRRKGETGWLESLKEKP